MRRTIIGPETGDDLVESAAGERAAFATATVVHRPGEKRVHVSSMVAEGVEEPDVERQTRAILSDIEDCLAEVDGDMGDVVRVRVYVRSPHLTPENLRTIHRVRGEFFDAEAFPASTLVEVERLVREAYVVEVDADAVVPEGGWETETLARDP